MFELLLTMAVSIHSCETTEEPYLVGTEICTAWNATCGYLEDSNGDLVDCGDCNHPLEYCGGSPPNADGTPGDGTPLTCGGGCSEAAFFTCESGVPIVCAVPGTAPYEHCTDQGDGNWCC